MLPNGRTGKPTSVGGALVLYQLKCSFGIIESDPGLPTIQVGPDRFSMPAASPLRSEHEKLTEFVNEIVEMPNFGDLRGSSVEKIIFDLDSSSRGRLLLAVAERHTEEFLFPITDLSDTQSWRARYAIARIAEVVKPLPVELDRDSLFDFLLYLSVRRSSQLPPEEFDWALLSRIEIATSGGSNLSQGENLVLDFWRHAHFQAAPLGKPGLIIERLTQWIDDPTQFYLVPDEDWSETVNTDLGRLPDVEISKWIALFQHLLTATSSRPSARWRKTAVHLMEVVGNPEIGQALERWLSLTINRSTLSNNPLSVAMRSSSNSTYNNNGTALRGLLWLVPLLPNRETLLRLVVSVALSSYKKSSYIGARAIKIGNAAVYALSEISSTDALGQLAVLKVKIRLRAAQKEIEKAFDIAAQKLNLPRDQVEEITIPTYGLETVGRRDEIIGEHRAELIVAGSDAHLRWFDKQGKLLKAVPASVKREHTATVRELQQGIKDIRATLASQRDRIEMLFLEQKSWPESIWRERYLDHPLIGTLVRRLIWCIGGTAAIFPDGEALDIFGKPFVSPNNAMVTLWHPAGRSIEEVVEWRRRIESIEIVQPFKQAHREVYLLTDAERTTNTYSNRFAAHVIRQHQFHALCGVRRWNNDLRLMVDQSFPPATRNIPAWGMRAEFWVEGIGSDFGTDTNDAGTFLRLVTDQVRFYRIGAAINQSHPFDGGYRMDAAGPGIEGLNEPTSLDVVPTIVFSEIMRDVDLFVGVSSVGNDPTWQDGGPEGRYREYWQSYSFGELSTSAVSRREAIRRIVPRLKIKDRCTVADRFLVVRGDKRVYKIHLGSGNILMEPNDQYLCIVPNSRARSGEGHLYLPFEGDEMLSIILSKAFLLADDSQIADKTILRQIDSR